MNSIIEKARAASVRRTEEMYTSKSVSPIEKEKEIAINWDVAYVMDGGK